MLETLKNLFAVADLRNRVLFTLGMLAVYRVGNHIPTPGVNSEALRILAEQAQNTLFGMYDMFTGGSLSRITIFALGVMPYISSSIILQLLTVVWPYLERLSKEGELGRRKITQYTRYLTLVLAIVQSLGIAIYLERQTQIAGGLPLVYEPGWGFRLVCMLTLTTGTMFIMWLGEQITERGIGNGMSLIIFAGIVVNFPRAVIATFDQLRTGQIGLLTMAILRGADGRRGRRDHLRRARPSPHHRAVRQARRRAPPVRRLEHAHPAQGQHRRRHPGDLRELDPDVPADVRRACSRRAAGWTRRCGRSRYGMPLYNLLYVLGIIFFAYFYTAIIFNPDDVSENMRKYGGFIPGIRPGKRTAEYIDTILARITLVGAIYLALVAILPEFLLTGFKIGPIPFIGADARRDPAELRDQRPWRDVLLRRHVAADRGRRGDGHREPGRVAADHAALRRVHEEDADQGTARLTWP